MNIINPYRFGVATTPIPLENIISEYKFEDNVLDTVGTNDGTPTAITYADGLVDRTGVFNGSTSKVTIPDSNDLSFGNGITDEPFSVSALVYKTGVQNNVIISKDDFTTTREWAFFITSDNDLRFFIKSLGGGVQQSIDSTTLLSNNQWYHVTATYDGRGGNTASYGIKLFINGVLETPTGRNEGVYVAMTNTASSTRIGNYGSNYFLGNLDCVRVWDKELSQAEVTEIATQELAGIDINPNIPLDNIISEYNFQNNVLDTVGTNHGTATAITYADGLVDRTGVFNGTTSIVTAPIASFSDGFGNDQIFSISCLVKLDAPSTNTAMLVSKMLSDGTSREYDLRYTGSTNEWRFTKYNALTNNGRRYGYVYAPLSTEWVHIVITNLNNGAITMYINGIAVTTTDTDVGTGYTAMGSGSGILNLGKYPAATSLTLDGNLDCVRFWNKELTQNEITNLATKELAGTDISEKTTLKEGLISVWEMNETSGTIMVDAYGANNGTITSATINQTGKLDKAYSFDGVNDSAIQTTIGSQFALTDKLSFSFWVKTTQVGSGMILESSPNYSVTADNWAIYIESGKIVTGMRVATGYLAYKTISSVNDGLWHHIVLICDRSELIKSDTTKVYIDGILETLIVVLDDAISWNGNFDNANLYFGAREQSSFFYDGLYDQIAMWNTTLTQDQVTALHNEDSGLAYSNW